MRVALFSSTIDVRNGYGNITHEYCRALEQAGIDFTLFLPSSEQAKKYTANFPIHYVLPDYIFRVWTLKFFPYLRMLNLQGYTLVHSLFDFPYAWYAARQARRHDLPFLMGSQGTFGVLPLTYFPERYLLKRAYRQACMITVPSQFTKEQIEKYAHERYPIEVIHNGVNSARFSIAPDVQSLQVQYGHGPFLLTVGGIKRRKGQDLVLQALPRILEHVPSLRYLIVGPTDLGADAWGAHLRDLATSLQIDHAVVFIGPLEGEALVAHFALATVFVLTPRLVNLNFEGFGIVYLEASACGKPIVATDTGGVRDAVQDGITGYIVPDGDVHAIADRVTYLLLHEEQARRMGEEGRAYAEAHDWQTIIRSFVALYQKYSL